MRFAPRRAGDDAAGVAVEVICLNKKTTQSILIWAAVIFCIAGCGTVQTASAGILSVYGADVLNTLPDWYMPGTAITLREIYWIDPTLNDIPGPDDEMTKPPSAGELMVTIRLASVDGGTYTGSTGTQSTLATQVPPGSNPWTYALGTENSIGLIFIDLNAVEPGPNGQPVVAVERGQWRIESGEVFNAVVLVSTAPEGFQSITNYRWVVDEDSGLVLHAEEYGYGGGATMLTTDPITGTAPGPTTIFVFDVTSITQETA